MLVYFVLDSLGGTPLRIVAKDDFSLIWQPANYFVHEYVSVGNGNPKFFSTENGIIINITVPKDSLKNCCAFQFQNN